VVTLQPQAYRVWAQRRLERHGPPQSPSIGWNGGVSESLAARAQEGDFRWWDYSHHEIAAAIMRLGGGGTPVRIYFQFLSNLCGLCYVLSLVALPGESLAGAAGHAPAWGCRAGGMLRGGH
jgi:hypothetical protein